MQSDFSAEHLAKLYAAQPAIHDLLQCSPFDASRNLDGRATPEIFFKHLFVEHETVRQKREELLGQLTDLGRNHRVIFLEGFSGSGKTTFIKYFIQTYSEAFESIYIDFFPLAQRKDLDGSRSLSPTALQKAQQHLEEVLPVVQASDTHIISKAINQLQNITTATKKAEEIWDRSHPVEGVLKAHLREQNEASLKSLLYFVYDKREPLSSSFSDGFAARLKNFEPGVEVHRLQEFLVTANLTDTFLLFFLYYSLLYEKRRTLTHLIIFDNLDSVELAYLTKFFKEAFVNAFSVYSQISQNRAIFPEIIEFNSKFKFLFCLRDANNTTINAHMKDQLVYLATPLYFRIGFDADLYQKVMQRRLDFLLFLQEKAVPSAESLLVKKVVEMLIAFSNDKFFKDILAPLLNFNFRKLTHLVFEATYDMVKPPTFKGGLSFENISQETFTESSSDRYGANGAILFGITKKLRESNFLEKYPFVPAPDIEQDGYCLSARMVLSVLLNKSDLEASRFVTEKAKPFRDVPLKDIIESASAAYDVAEIVATLVEVFLLHNESWVHLVTFRNRPVEDKHAFESDIHEIAHTGKVPDRLKDVLVTLNPSGFIFLKILITHFEFYSVIAKNNHALYTLGLQTSSNNNTRYLFEDCIASVQHFVLRHVISMKKFYQTKFSKEPWTDQMYLASDFVFKHFKSGAPSARGVFHSTRVVTIHIRYLDEFRLWVLKKNEARVVTELIAVNQKLVTAIEKYIEMLINWTPGQGEFKAYETAVTEKIELIKNSEYRDMKTRIAPTAGN